VGIRTPTHLYFLPFTEKPKLADEPQFFFDLERDPYQMENLAGTHPQIGVAGHLDSILRKWHQNTPWMPDVI
jgi:hypothetical protein